jgi:hypothetical protein
MIAGTDALSMAVLGSTEMDEQEEATAEGGTNEPGDRAKGSKEQAAEGARNPHPNPLHHAGHCRIRRQ